MNRQIVTVFMIQSIDGKISFNGTGRLDFDDRIPTLSWSAKGIKHYYEAKFGIDDTTLISGKTLEIVGWNDKVVHENKELTLVVIDNNHLTGEGLLRLHNSNKRIILVTNRLWYLENMDNLPYDVIYYREDRCSIGNILDILYTKYNIKYVTVQGGGEINASLFKERRVDYIDIIIAPFIVGGRNTPGCVGGESLSEDVDIREVINEYSLISVDSVGDSYVRVRYASRDRIKDCV